MTKEEIRAKAVDNANNRINTEDTRCIVALADYDLGLRQGFEDGAEWMQERMQETNEGQALLYAVEKTAKRTKREIVEKAVNWLDEQMCFGDLSSGRGSWGEVKTLGGYDSLEEFIDEFKQAMQDERKDF